MPQIKLFPVPIIVAIMLVATCAPARADRANTETPGKTYETLAPSRDDAGDIARRHEDGQDKLIGDLRGQVEILNKKLEKAEQRLAHARYRQAYYAEVERLRHRQKEPGAAEPLPFSHFASQSWRDEVRELRHSLAYEQAFRLPMVVESQGYVTYAGKGNAIIDGVWESGMDVFWLANNAANEIRIMAPALNAGGTPLLVIADAGIDEVLLDGCLVWTRKTPEGGLEAWEAKDKDGKTAVLKLNRGLSPKVEEACDRRYILRHVMRFMPAILGGPQDADGGAGWAMMEPLLYADEPLEKYTPQIEQDVVSYKADFFKDEKKQSLKQLVIAQMEKGALPSRLPEWQYSEKRNLAFTLEKLSARDIANEKILRLASPNAGTNANAEMLVLEKGWGRHEATGSCALADMKGAIFAVHKELPNTVGGIGVYPYRDSSGHIVISVMKDGAADAAGLQSNDVITGIEGMRVDQMDEATAIGKLRGKPGTTVTVTGNFKSASSPVTMTRKILRGGETVQGLARANIEWPHPFYNFIVFGPGLRESDMAWSKNRMRLKNKKTKDEIIFPVPACYSLVYTAEAKSR